MITIEEVEMLAALLQRTGVTVYEAAWANMMLDKLRAIAAEQGATQAPTAKTQPRGQEVTKSPKPLDMG